MAFGISGISAKAVATEMTAVIALIKPERKIV